MCKKEETIRLISGNILETIFRHQTSSRTSISKATGLTPATVTNTINLLVSNNKVIETGDEVRVVKGSGRSRRLITINKNFKHYIGIEINATGIFLTITDTLGNKVKNSKTNIDDYNYKKINDVLINLIANTIKKFPELRFGGIGISVPGHFEHQTGRIISNNSKWEFFQISEIKKKIHLPIFLENNINCMAVAEYLFHPESSPEQFLFIHIGPGLFCSFFDNHSILKKKNFYIGEIGHTIVDHNGPICECGKRGCLQTYISDTWLIKNAEFLFENAKNTIIKTLVASPADLNLEVIYHSYLLGDSFIIDKIESGIQFLATSIANTLIIYDSQKVYINSQLFNYPGFSEKLITLINEQLQFIPTKRNLNIDILPFNPYRGASGAAALAVYNNLIWENNSQA
ncbi:ROK family protein [Streptococcus sp. ZJ93]|uniref:ROK family protein n=1 Tax=Streptococcus handemini TaxID=3161188 RepID=UPI0032EFB9C9